MGAESRVSDQQSDAKPKRKRRKSYIEASLTYFPDVWAITCPTADAPKPGDVIEADKRQWRVLEVREASDSDNPTSWITLVPVEWDSANDDEVRARVLERRQELARAVADIEHMKVCGWGHHCEKHKDGPFCAAHRLEYEKRRQQIQAEEEEARRRASVQFGINTGHDDQLLARHHKRGDDRQPLTQVLRAERRRSTRTTRHLTHAVMVPGDMVTLTVAASGTDDPSLYTVAYILSESREPICVADGVGDQIVQGHQDYLTYDVPTLDDLISQARARLKEQGNPQYKVTVDVMT